MGLTCTLVRLGFTRPDAAADYAHTRASYDGGAQFEVRRRTDGARVLTGTAPAH